MLLEARPSMLRVALFSSLLAITSPPYAWGLGLDSKAKGLAHYIMAVYHDLNAESSQAISEYQKSVKFNGLEPAPRLELGVYYLRLNEINKAVVQLKEAARLDPANTTALYLLGSVYADSHDRPKAVKTFRQLLQIDPHNSEALNSLGYMYAEAGVHLDEAIRMTREAIAIDGSNGAYYDSLGWALYKKGMLRPSLAALQTAEMYVEDETLYDHMGDVLKALKQYTRACDYWRKSLGLNPRQISVQRKMEELEKWIASPSSHRLK